MPLGVLSHQIKEDQDQIKQNDQIRSDKEGKEKPA